MKPRKVMVHLELETDVTIPELRLPQLWGFRGGYKKFVCHQITVQVVKEKK